MTFSQCFKRRGLRFVSLFLTILIVIGFTAVLQVNATPDSSHSQTTIVVRNAVSIPVVTADRLPPEARSTINLIRQGGPYPSLKTALFFAIENVDYR